MSPCRRRSSPATSKALLQRAAIIAAGALAIAALAVLGVSLLMSRAVRRIAQRTERIRNLDFSDPEPVTSSITELRQLSDSVENMRQGLQIFGRYVSGIWWRRSCARRRMPVSAASSASSR